MYMITYRNTLENIKDYEIQIEPANGHKKVGHFGVL